MKHIPDQTVENRRLVKTGPEAMALALDLIKGLPDAAGIRYQFLNTVEARRHERLQTPREEQIA